VDQAHEQIAHVGPAPVAVERRALAMADGVRKPSFADIVIQRCCG
jgi:hypothetical protein